MSEPRYSIPLGTLVHIGNSYSPGRWSWSCGLVHPSDD
jgi:hypothetical protein